MYDSDSDSYWPDAQITPDDYGGNLDVSYANALAQQAEYDRRAADQLVADSLATNPQYQDYGSPEGRGAAGTSYEVGPTGGASGIKNLLNKLTRDSKGNLDYAKLAMLLYGAKTLAKGPGSAPKLGFQGSIPTYQATNNLMTAPPAGRKAGAYGINYGDTKYNKMAEGGLTNLASGRYLQGETDGMADKIPAQIGQDQPAALSHGEFVIPADVVSHLGNGNSDAGAKKLYQMMDKVRQARTGQKKQGKQINPDKFMPGGLAKAYAEGGAVQKFAEGGTPTSGEQTLSTWAAPYVTDMLAKGQALSNQPYQAYTGQLTAAPSELQTKVSSGLNSVDFPGNFGKSFSSSGAYTPPPINMGAYNTQPIGTGPQPGGINALPESNGLGYGGGGGNANGLTGGSQPTTMVEAQANQPQNNGIASQYMNPYLTSVLDPQLAELRRTAQINNLTTLGGLTKSGAYGGGRQAIMESEAGRNLLAEQNKAIGQGYANAYDKAMGQFNTEQTQGQALAKMMAEQGATDRGIEAEQIAADKAQFEEARANPYKQVQFQQSLLDKLPIQTTNYGTVTPSMLETLSGNMKTMNELLDRLGLLEKKP